MKTLAKMVAIGASALILAGLGGCSLDDVQFNGKIFDAVGMNTGSVKKEAKVAERSPLVVPPELDKLPVPGSGKADQPTLADVKDYDQSKQTSQADLQHQQEEYCKVHYEQAKAHGDNNADLATGPLGPCRGSVFSAIKNINKDDDSEAQ